MADKYEYKITYRRADWRSTTASKTRVFSTLDGLNKFIEEKLNGRGRPELARVSEWKVQRRTVGAWRHVQGSVGRSAR